MRFRLTLSLLLPLLLASPPAAAEPTVEFRRFDPTPSGELQLQWIERFFAGDEIWSFESPELLDMLLEASELNDAQKRAVVRASTQDLPHADRNRIASRIRATGEDRIFVRVSPSLKRRLRRSFLIDVYTFLALRNDIPLLTYSSLDEAKQHFREHGITPENARKLARKLKVASKGELYLLPLTPDVAPLLSDTFREATLAGWTPGHVSGLGLTGTLKFASDDDLPKLADTLAGPRSSKALLQYLRALVRQSPDGRVSVPLEKLAPLFIRRNVNSFSPCGGPNCFNAALNVATGASSRGRFTDLDELVNELIQNFRLIPPGDPLRLGDALLYTDPTGMPIHMASYIAPGVVFTKNGLNEQNPYVFQPEATMERAYFKNKAFNLVAFRKTAPGEPPLDPHGLRPGISPPLQVYRTGKGPTGPGFCELSTALKALLKVPL